jgi:hypothetical protein
MNHRFLLTAILLFSTLPVCAQLEFSATTLVDQYQDEFRHIYRPGHTYLFSLGVNDREQNKRFTLTGNFGYGLYTPKADTFPTIIARNEIFGYNTYSDYQVFQFTIGLRRDFILWRHLELYVGMEMGYHFTSYRCTTYKGTVKDSDRFVENRLPLIPFAGISIPIHRFCLFAQTQYNFSADRSADDDRNLFNRIWSNGVGIRYRLEEPLE